MGVKLLKRFSRSFLGLKVKDMLEVKQVNIWRWYKQSRK